MKNMEQQICTKCRMEITFINIADEGQKMVQYAWLGRGNMLLIKQHKSLSVQQCRCVCDTAIRTWWDVFYAVGIAWSLKCEAERVVIICIIEVWIWELWVKIPTSRVPFAANFCTQCMVGEFSLNSATSFPSTIRGIILLSRNSITSHNINSLAYSKSKLVMVPFGYFKK